MNIPMEFLSPTTRADSGKGLQAPSARMAENTRKTFGKVFEQELTKNEQKVQSKNKNPEGNAVNTDYAKGTKPKEIIKNDYGNARAPNEKLEIDDEEGAVLAAGVKNLTQWDLGIKEQEVVYILEGEDSVATPETRVENNAEKPELKQQAQQETAKVPIPADEESDGTKVFEKIIKEANTFNKDSAQEAIHAKGTEPVIKETAVTKTDAATQNDKQEVAGEVTARTPEVKPQEGQTNGQQGGNLKDNGNPGHLENANEKAQTTGQEDKTYTKAADIARNVLYAKTADAGENNYQTGKADTEKNTFQAIETDTTKSTAYTKAADAVKNKLNTQTADKPAEITETGTSAPPPPLTNGIKPEQFRAAQQMMQAAQGAPVKPENLFEEMISKVQSAHTADKSVMTIQLNPEFLGKVALEVGLDANGLHVKINAEDSSVRGMINSQLAALIESLENKGITVSEVEVVFAGANFDNFSQADDNRQGAGANKHLGKQGSNARDGIEQYSALMNIMDFYLDSGISSVEYCA